MDLTPYKDTVLELLKHADLTKLSLKQVRKQIELQYKTDFSNHKKEFELFVVNLIEKNTKNEPLVDQTKRKAISEDTDTAIPHKDIKSDPDLAAQIKRDAELAAKLSEPISRRQTRNMTVPLKPKRKHVKSKKSEQNTAVNLPPQLSKFLKSDSLTKPEIISKTLEYIDSNNLLDPSDAKYCICDEPLEILLSEKRIHLYAMLKKLYSMLDSNQDQQQLQRNNAFNKLLDLSPELSSLLQEEQLSRPKIVKSLWDYIRLFKLQDPNNKKFILCDDAMQAVFKTRRVSMFKMNNIISRHISPAQDSDDDKVDADYETYDALSTTKQQHGLNSDLTPYEVDSSDSE